MPSDRLVAISIASLRGAASAGPQRDEEKTCMNWGPTRWQLADALTKPGLESVPATRLASATTRLHEVSAAALKKKKVKSVSYVWNCGVFYQENDSEDMRSGPVVHQHEASDRIGQGLSLFVAILHQEGMSLLRQTCFRDCCDESVSRRL